MERKKPGEDKIELKISELPKWHPKIYIDPDIPPDEVHFIDSAGVRHRIVGLAVPAEDGSHQQQPPAVEGAGVEPILEGFGRTASDSK